MTADLPPLSFGEFNNAITTIRGVVTSGSVTLIARILLLVLAWENRKTIGKIVVEFLALLLLPIIMLTMLMMLPAAMFGSDSSGDYASILDKPVTETVVFENLGVILEEYSDTCSVVDLVMSDAHLRAIEEITKDLDRYDSDDNINIFDLLEPMTARESSEITRLCTSATTM